MYTTSNPVRSHLSPADQAVLEQIRGRSIARFGFDAFRMEEGGDGGQGSGQSGEQGAAGAGGDGDKAAGQGGEQGGQAAGQADGQKAGQEWTAEKVDDLPRPCVRPRPR